MENQGHSEVPLSKLSIVSTRPKVSLTWLAQRCASVSHQVQGENRRGSLSTNEHSWNSPWLIRAPDTTSVPGVVQKEFTDTVVRLPAEGRPSSAKGSTQGRTRKLNSQTLGEWRGQSERSNLTRWIRTNWPERLVTPVLHRHSNVNRTAALDRKISDRA